MKMKAWELSLSRNVSLLLGSSQLQGHICGHRSSLSLGARAAGASGSCLHAHVFSHPRQQQSRARKPRAKSKSKIDLLRKCIEDKIQLFGKPAPEDLVEKVSASPSPAVSRCTQQGQQPPCGGCPDPQGQAVRLPLCSKPWSCGQDPPLPLTPFLLLLLSGSLFPHVSEGGRQVSPRPPPATAWLLGLPPPLCRPVLRGSQGWPPSSSSAPPVVPTAAQPP